ncbi:MAG TPA: glycosyltransferase family 2 protein [Candidatus Angelobacter sp.]|nr:glycosyltransferase family 2 protein [Candidatus Angelobacter sp.]
MLSVVVPIFNEEENVPAFHAELDRVLSRIPEPAEIVYVNDGSRDASLERLVAVQQKDPRVTVVELSRNFGHQAALTAGMSTAQGDAVVLMDGDFQDPPEVVPRLFQAWKSGAKVVIANRTSRAERGIRGKLFPLFYKVMRWLSDYPIPLNAGIFGLLDRQAVDAIKGLQESNRYLPGMRAWIGFPTAFVAYDRAERAAGEPKQTFSRLLKYGLDAIFSFSYKPLRLGMTLGAVVLTLALFLVVLGLAAAMIGLPFVRADYFVIFLALLFLGGIQLVCIGLLGEYVGRIYDEVRRRPLFLIHHLYRSENTQTDVLREEIHTLSKTESAA